VGFLICFDFGQVLI